MNRTPVTSSSINSIGYDAETKILEVEFNTGAIYRYLNVTESEYAGLMDAESVGAYFSKHIKGKYEYYRP